MKIFKTIEDVERLGREHDSCSTIKELVEQLIEAYSDYERPYCPEDDGYIVLVEEGDVDRVLEELLMPYRLVEVPWEGVNMIDSHFYALYLANNQFGIGFLIPDEEWVNGELRQVLLNNHDPE